MLLSYITLEGLKELLKAKQDIEAIFHIMFSISIQDTNLCPQEVQRAVLTPDEIMRLPGLVKDLEQNISELDDMLLFTAGFKPVYGKQILYFLVETFLERPKMYALEKKDKLR